MFCSLRKHAHVPCCRLIDWLAARRLGMRFQIITLILGLIVLAGRLASQPMRALLKLLAPAADDRLAAYLFIVRPAARIQTANLVSLARRAWRPSQTAEGKPIGFGSRAAAAATVCSAACALLAHLAGRRQTGRQTVWGRRARGGVGGRATPSRL